MFDASSPGLALACAALITDAGSPSARPSCKFWLEMVNNPLTGAWKLGPRVQGLREWQRACWSTPMYPNVSDLFLGVAAILAFGLLAGTVLGLQ